VGGKGVGGATGVLPTLQDSVEEFKVNTAGQTADFNSSSGSEVKVVTKRGTDAWHGTAYEYYKVNHHQHRRAPGDCRIRKSCRQRPRIVGDALNKVAADPEVEVAMFEILEIQKILESKTRIILIPEKGGILPELLASTSRSPEPALPLRPMGKATAQT
jgi:hypothetical protein